MYSIVAEGNYKCASSCDDMSQLIVLYTNCINHDDSLTTKYMITICKQYKNEKNKSLQERKLVIYMN